MSNNIESVQHKTVVNTNMDKIVVEEVDESITQNWEQVAKQADLSPRSMKKKQGTGDIQQSTRVVPKRAATNPSFK